jgi:hypothetical protein
VWIVYHIHEKRLSCPDTDPKSLLAVLVENKLSCSECNPTQRHYYLVLSTRGSA